MWKQISIKTRILFILAAIVIVSTAAGFITMWYTHKVESILSLVIDKDVAAYKTAIFLETALINQKGFVSYYFLDKDPDWLRQLGEYRQIFKQRLDEATATAEGEREKTAIETIRKEYEKYVHLKDMVIEYYKSAGVQGQASLHPKSRGIFFKILSLCEDYKNIHEDRIKMAVEDSRSRSMKFRMISYTAMISGLFLALLLAFMLVNQIFGPVRKLAIEADREGKPFGSKNEISALSRSVRGLIKDVDLTHSELKKSQEHLLQAEKMALVGKLAAGMAHSIRNPFTSIKMRLFSLNRSLDLTDPQQEDFQVISEEIRHVDTIVQNFLEFSRPPKLQVQTVSPSTIVDSTIQLLAHRLRSYDATVKVNRKKPLPQVEADPEQLKEVLVNLMINACESMEDGGRIVVDEEEQAVVGSKRVAVIRVTDDGPGVPESIQEKIFQPFFTTKEEGTGLGLSIAERIVKEHGGDLRLISKEGEGSTFVIVLPIKETDD